MSDFPYHVLLALLLGVLGLWAFSAGWYGLAATLAMLGFAVLLVPFAFHSVHPLDDEAEEEADS